MLLRQSFAPLYSLVRFLLDAPLTRRQSELRLRAEVVALCHQIAALAGSPATAGSLRKSGRPSCRPRAIASIFVSCLLR
jgi:hypothetical protein